MKNLFGLVQDSNPAAILQMMKTADTLHMPKILACCERHVAIDAAKTMRTKAFWEQLPACSSVRIVRGLDAAYEVYKAQATSKIRLWVANCPNCRRYNNSHGIRSYMDDADVMVNDSELKVSVPSCKAFLKMTEPILSQAKEVPQS